MKIKAYFWRKVVCLILKSRLRKRINNYDLYVIKGVPKTGFFSNYFYAVGHARLASKYGYKYVIDWQNYTTPYNEKKPINGTMNCFEYYFDQNTSIREVDLAKNIYVSEDKYPYCTVPHYGVNNFATEGFPNKKLVKKINAFTSKNCPLKSGLRNEFERLAFEMNLRNCLGVHIRGTDMNCTLGHNKPASLNKTVNMIKRTLSKTGLNQIFLCTDEEKIKNQLIETFGDKVKCLEVYRSNGGNEGIHLENCVKNRESHNYLLGLEVLIDAYLLSKCSSLVCGKSNVAYSAIVFNNNCYNKIVLTN